MDYENITLKDEIELERRAKTRAEEAARRVLQNSCSNGRATETQVGKGMMDYAYDKFIKSIREFVTYELQPKCGVQAAYHNMLEQLAQIYDDKTHLYAVLALSTMARTMDYVFIRKNELSTIAKRIGESIEDDANLVAFENSNPENLKELNTGLKKRVGEHFKKYYIQHKAMTEAGFNWIEWNTAAKIKLGGKLIECLVSSTTLFEIVHINHGTGRTSMDKLNPSQLFIDLWNINEVALLQNTCRAIPTIIPPKEWTSYTDGGYYGELRTSYPLMRLHKNKTIFFTQYLEKLKQTDLTSVLRAVNAVQSTPWKINTRVLKVVEEIVKNGGDLAGIPKFQPYDNLPRLEGDYTEEELKEHKKLAVELIHRENARKGRALRCLSMLAIAKEYAPYKRIFFPCNMDFRGRVYPIPAFSFQGDDLTKGLLLLADTPAATDEKAEYWMRVAGCEFYGNDKVSFDDQIQWTKDSEEAILSVANDPLGKDKGFWANSDCPVEFLGWCFEYKDMLSYKDKHNGSVIGWTCGVPVAFDGTCSGLQHFSAALRDEIGGRSVNLIPGDKPRDIYGEVAEKVNVMLRENAKSGTSDAWMTNKFGEKTMKWGTRTLAQQWLAYGVNRKVTKRCVMTLAYGAKQFGFKEQILEDTLNDVYGTDKGSMFTASKNTLALYMAKLIWQAASQTVVKAFIGMKWLQDISAIVCKTGDVVTWNTPMGLPIQQNYMETHVKKVKMRFLNLTKNFYVPEETGNVAKKKQTQGIAPNFIHSMDAAHLQLSINMCLDKGIHHFSMIHDSYATSPAQADTLFHTVREAFVKMYEENDVLQNFYEDMKTAVGTQDKPLPCPPSEGKLDIRQVLDSLYVFH